MIENFTRYDIRHIMNLIEEIESEYREESSKHDGIQKMAFLATARGASVCKLKIKMFLKKKYNIQKL